jgi:hypothetical protein
VSPRRSHPPPSTHPAAPNHAKLPHPSGPPAPLAIHPPRRSPRRPPLHLVPSLSFSQAPTLDPRPPRRRGPGRRPPHRTRRRPPPRHRPAGHHRPPSVHGLPRPPPLPHPDHRRSRHQLAESRAQARSLESQIRPDFFFNTLNTVSAIIPDQPAEAQRILGQFANLFRGALSGADGQPVPLTSELALVRDYLESERARFGPRLRFTLPDATAHPDLAIPPLTLQPLGENAVRHGIATLLDGGEITVSLTLHPTAYQIVITNPFDEPPVLTLQALLSPGHSLLLITRPSPSPMRPSGQPGSRHQPRPVPAPT